MAGWCADIKYEEVASQLQNKHIVPWRQIFQTQIHRNNFTQDWTRQTTWHHRSSSDFFFSFPHLCSGSQYKSNSLLWKEKIPIYCLPFSSWWMSVNVCIQNINILATCDGPPSSVKGKLIKWGHALTIFLLLIYFLNYSEKDLNTEQTKNKVEG